MQENATYSSDCPVCRAKVLQTGQWIQGYLYQKTNENEKKSYVIADSVMSPGSLTKPEMIEVDTDSICRHTGYRKNGIDIWENDKIQYHFGKEIGTIRFGRYQNCFDSQTAEHDGFYVEWGEGVYLRKDLGYWLNFLDDDNVISLDKGGI